MEPPSEAPSFNRLFDPANKGQETVRQQHQAKQCGRVVAHDRPNKRAAMTRP
jgi:hypothetical protein